MMLKLYGWHYFTLLQCQLIFLLVIYCRDLELNFVSSNLQNQLIIWSLNNHQIIFSKTTKMFLIFDFTSKIDLLLLVVI